MDKEMNLIDQMYMQLAQDRVQWRALVMSEFVVRSDSANTELVNVIFM
jgi:hypothetical protein